MSHEYGPRQHSDQDTLNAESCMLHDLNQAESLENFVLQIESSHEEQQDGRADLLQLMRAAQFICQSDSNGFDKNAQAFYAGELLGLELCKHLFSPETSASKSVNDLVLAYIKKTQDKDIRTGIARAPKKRQFIAGNKILNSLLEERLSEDYELYNRTITTLLENVSDNNEPLVRAGFWLIVKETLHPTVASNASGDNGSQHDEGADYYESSAVVDAAPSLETLREITDDPEDPKWDDIAPLRKKFITNFIPLLTSFRELDLRDDVTAMATKRLYESRLNALNREGELVSTNDLVRVSGDLFGITTDHENGNESLQLFTSACEIVGAFNCISLVEVPPNKDLLRIMNRKDEVTYDPNTRLVPSPAIRIENPSIVEFNSNGTSSNYYSEHTSVDIPLVYKNVILERLKPLNPLDFA